MEPSMDIKDVDAYLIHLWLVCAPQKLTNICHHGKPLQVQCGEPV